MIDRTMSSSAAFVALAAISYVQALALSFAMEVIIRFGTAGLLLASVAWAVTVVALEVWHGRRLLWIAPQLLVLVGLITFLEAKATVRHHSNGAYFKLISWGQALF